MSRRKYKVYRDGQVHVLADKCSTCIFRSVNDGRIMLEPGRVARMVLDARGEPGGSGNIPCHSTIWAGPSVKPAICKGFYDLPHKPALLELAAAMQVVTFDPPPPADTEWVGP